MVYCNLSMITSCLSWYWLWKIASIILKRVAATDMNGPAFLNVCVCVCARVEQAIILSWVFPSCLLWISHFLYRTILCPSLNSFYLYPLDNSSIYSFQSASLRRCTLHIDNPLFSVLYKWRNLDGDLHDTSLPTIQCLSTQTSPHLLPYFWQLHHHSSSHSICNCWSYILLSPSVLTSKMSQIAMNISSVRSIRNSHSFHSTIFATMLDSYALWPILWP